jgi:hypothetical protein
MRLFLLPILLSLFSSPILGCHALALLNVSVSATSTDIIVNANSDPATWLCGPHTLQVELSTTGQFTGTSPAFSSSQWGSFPWYHSLLNIPNYGPPQWQDFAAVEPYQTIMIPFSVLCPGATVSLRMREYLVGSASAGPWTQAFTFQVPGTLPNINSVITSLPSNCNNCNGTASLTITGGTPPYTYSWPNGDTASSSAPYCIGSYMVYAHDAIGCPVSSQFQIGDSCLLGFDEQSKASDVIFPNPANDVIFVKLGDCAGDLLYWEAMDYSGRSYPISLVGREGNIITLQTSSVSAGVYILKLHYRNRIVYSQFVVVH